MASSSHDPSPTAVSHRRGHRLALITLAMTVLFVCLWREWQPDDGKEAETLRPAHSAAAPESSLAAQAQRSRRPAHTAVLPDAESVPSSRHTTKPLAERRLLNGVILFLYGGRWHDYFVRETLPRLHRYVLRCFPYPVHVFHEGISEKEKQGIVVAATGGGGRSSIRVDFEDVGYIWKRLPKGVTEESLRQWMAEGVQPKFQGRGYRIMCRFWAGLAWTLPSMDRYAYYWRLDTDSLIVSPVKVDPFASVFEQRRCDYAFNRLKGENPHVAVGIYDAFEAWARADAVDAKRLQTVRAFALKNPKDPSSYWAPMFYNNFEMGSFQMKRSELYQGFFRYVDSKPPFGIMRYRWGDAPLHTLGVVVALDGQSMCNVTREEVDYRHAVKHPPPLVPEAACSIA
jgi:hypothetical protein